MTGILSQLYSNILDTSWLEVVAVVFGILSVWFARKENIWVYPTGIINVLVYVYLCFYAGLYADMVINAFYFVMSVFGWYNWSRRDASSQHVPISGLNRKQWLFYILLMAIAFGIIYYVLSRFTDSTVPMFDSFTTALFIAGMWLMAIKKIENWLLWIAGDVLVIPLFAYKGLVFTSVQYIVFLVLAVMGYLEWRKRMMEKVII
ncbi:MAG: nicotinamide riboside transporter PnuC [Bacteroidota bacterium]